MLYMFLLLLIVLAVGMHQETKRIRRYKHRARSLSQLSYVAMLPRSTRAGAHAALVQD